MNDARSTWVGEWVRPLVTSPTYPHTCTPPPTHHPTAPVEADGLRDSEERDDGQEIHLKALPGHVAQLKALHQARGHALQATEAEHVEHRLEPGAVRGPRVFAPHTWTHTPIGWTA